MKKRVQVLLNEEDIERFSNEAKEKQLSLSALLRLKIFNSNLNLVDGVLYVHEESTKDGFKRVS